MANATLGDFSCDAEVRGTGGFRIVHGEKIPKMRTWQGVAVMDPSDAYDVIDEGQVEYRGPLTFEGQTMRVKGPVNITNVESDTVWFDGAGKWEELND